MSTQADTNSQSVASFHNFPLLPAEIRLKIWNMAMETPRTITIDMFVPRVPRPWKRFVPYTGPPLKIERLGTPVVLHTCSESREEALRRYTLYSSSRFQTSFYVNFSADTLGFKSLSAFQILYKNQRHDQEQDLWPADIIELENAQSLAMDENIMWDIWDNYTGDTHMTQNVFDRFQGLREVKIYPNRWMNGKTWDIMSYKWAALEKGEKSVKLKFCRD